MTIIGIIIAISGCLMVLGVAGFFIKSFIDEIEYQRYRNNKNGERKEIRKVAIVGGVALMLCVALISGLHWYYNNTATGQRELKSQESELSNGIERRVRVYDVNGTIIQEYDGKFDVTYDGDRILFDDENGNRHVIYYPTGTVIVDEK